MGMSIDIMIDAADVFLYTLVDAIGILIALIMSTMYIIEKGGGYVILILLLLIISLSLLKPFLR